MRRALSSHWGGGGGEEEGRHALETTDTQVEMALWEISLSANKAAAWTPASAWLLGKEAVL